MNNEWTRYQSFLGIPDFTHVSPIELAQAGFYSTGKEEYAVCFFCELKIGKWNTTETETVFQLHRRLSPNCGFIKGEDTTNAAIYRGKCGSNNTDEANKETDRTDHYVTTVMETEQTAEQGYMELRAQHISDFLLDKNYVKNDAATGYSNQTTSSNDKESLTSSSACALKKAPNTQKQAESIGKQECISKEKQTLLEENRQLKDRMTCKICMDKDACIVFLPCGHMVSCVECAHALRKCAVCRTVIQGTVRAYPA